MGTAATQGAVTGVTGGVTEGATGGASKLIGQANKAGQEATVAGVNTRVGARALEAAEPTANQKGLQEGLRNVAGDTTKAATGLKGRPNAGTSMRDVFSGSADRIMDKSKSMFQKIDDATNNTFQVNRNALAENKLKMRAATTDEDFDNLVIEQKRLLGEQQEIFDAAKSAGVDEKTVEQARNAYKQASALEELNKHVEMSTKGTKPEVAKSQPNQVFSPETVNADQLNSRLNKMGDRLADAVGDKQAKDVLALTDLMKENPDSLNNFTMTAGKYLLKHPVKGGAGVAISSAKDLWSAVLNSPKATALAKLALSTGASAAKAVPAIVSALQTQNQ